MSLIVIRTRWHPAILRLDLWTQSVETHILSSSILHILPFFK
jgi:hypothetical protein